MGYWARQDTLNDKLGESVNLNKGANYWPTKTEILDNWNAEVPDTYAANQWCDIDDIKEGAVMIYRRYFWTHTQLSKEFKYSEVFEGLVGESKCDVCLVGRGGNGGLWTAWGTGFGGAGGGGNVHNYMGVYFTKWYKANTRENLNPADNMKINNSNSADNNQFSTLSFKKTAGTFGELLTNMKSASDGKNSTPNEINGEPGNGGGAYVCDFVYSDKENCIIDSAATGTINKELLPGSHNTSRYEPNRSETYNLKGNNWDTSKSIGEFNENYVLHAAPGVECWFLHRDSIITPTKNTGTPQQYVGTCPFNHGGGSIMYTNNRESQEWNNKGGRGGGGAGGGAAGGDYIDTMGSGSNQANRFIGGDGAVIIRYMGKRVFPAGRTWTIKFRLQLFAATSVCVGFMLEGRSFEYFPIAVKDEQNNQTVLDAPFGVYDAATGLNSDITVSNVLPEGFEPTRAWLILATNNPELSTAIVASIVVNDLNDKTNYVTASKTATLKNIKDDYICAKTFLDHVKPNNRSLQYIDITDVLRNSKSADAAKNSYYIGINLVANHQPVTRSYVFRKDKTPEALGDFVLQPNNGTMRYLDVSGNPVSGLYGYEFQNQLEYRPKPYNSEKTFIRFSAGCSRVTDFLNVKYQNTTKFPTSNFIEVTHNFSDTIPAGYRLGFEPNKRITLQANAVTLTRDSVTVKYPLNCWHPNTNLIRWGEVFGEYWIEADTGTMVIREYMMGIQLDSNYTINVPTFSITAKNLTTNETIPAMPMPSDGSGVEKIQFGLMIKNYNATDIIEVTLDFDVSNTPGANYVIIGGSGLYTRITDTKIAIQNNMSVFDPASPNTKNIGGFNVYNFQDKYLEWAYTPDEFGEKCTALDFDQSVFQPLDMLIGNDNSSGGIIKFKPVNSIAVGVVNVGGKSYLKYKYNQFVIPITAEVGDYVEATFKLKMPSNLVNANYKVKASNVLVGAGLITYPDNSTIKLKLPIIHFNLSQITGIISVSAKYMVEPTETTVIYTVQIINKSVSEGIVFLFDEFSSPELSGIQYLGLMMIADYNAVIAELEYDSKGTKTFSVNTTSGLTKKIGFGDKLKIYRAVTGNSAIVYMGTVTLDGNPILKTFNV